MFLYQLLGGGYISFLKEKKRNLLILGFVAFCWTISKSEKLLVSKKSSSKAMVYISFSIYH